MEYVSYTAQQAAERLLSIRMGFILFIVLVICFTIWATRVSDKAAKCSIARTKAFNKRTSDNNATERKNWIDANCDLMGQVELLKSENERLRKDNDRMRNIMAQVKVADL